MDQVAITPNSEQERAAPSAARYPMRGIYVALVVSALIHVITLVTPGITTIVFTAGVYVPLHMLLEMAAIVVSFTVFAIYWTTWSPREQTGDSRGLVVGVAFLTVAIIDSFHMLSFPGMPDFVTPSSVEKGIVYFLWARGWAVLSLLLATCIRPTMRHPLMQRGPLLVINLAVAAASFVVVTYFFNIIPPMYSAGQGLTALKIALEYVVVGIAALSAIVYTIQYRRSGDQFARLIAIAMVITVFGESFFAFYASAYDIFNLLGHVYNVVAYAFIFDALFISAVQKPHAALRDAYAQVDAQNKELARLNDEIDNQLKRTIAQLKATLDIATQRAAVLDTTISAIGDGVVIFDLKGEVLRMNASAERILGFTLAEHQALPPEKRAERLHMETPQGEPIPPEQALRERALHGETITGSHLTIVLPDGTRRHVLVSAAPIKDQQGTTWGAVSIFTDINGLINMEERREDLLRMVSHDLRGPLTVIQAHAELLNWDLQAAGLNGQRLESTDAIITASRRMNTMIQDLVDSARLEAGRLHLHREPIDLATFLPGFLHRLSTSLETSRVHVSIEPGLPPVIADPDRLERIVTNLLSNALKYSTPGTPIEITCRRQGPEVEMSFADQGQGIHPEDVPHIFERFYRTHGPRKRESVGLGLYTTKMLVEAHNGRITVASQPGKGSVFIVTLPTTKCDPGQDQWH